MDQTTLYGWFILLFLGAGAVAIYLIIHNQRQEIASLKLQLAEAQNILAVRSEELHRVLSILSEPDRERLERELRRRVPLKNPPGFETTLERLRQQADDTYEFALGWNTDSTNSSPNVVCVTLNDSSDYRSGHIAVTGESGHGKGTLEQAILLQLAHNTSTSQLRIQIIDPKSSDAALWLGKAHLWKAPVIGEDQATIKAAMAALREERQKRDKLRTSHRVREWHELPAEIRPPRLVVWITELATVSKAIDKFDDWLEDELSKCRASGITYLIDLQNQSGKDMRWRTHVGTFVAGFQSSSYHIQPNVGMPASELLQLGGILPTELKRGQFLLRNKRDVSTVAAPLMTTSDIQQALDALPNQAATVAAPTPGAGVIAHDRRELEVMLTEPVTDDLTITPELWTKIVAAAREVEASRPNPSRADVYRAVFANNDPKATPTGRNYRMVKRVCDEERLLLPRITPPASLSGASMLDAA